MADETYRKFHSGRFGPEGIDINFETKIEGSKGVSSKSSDPREVDKKIESKEVDEPESMKEFKRNMNARTKAPFGTSSGE